VKLPEDDVTTFTVFAEWLYLGNQCDTGAIFEDAHGKNVAENDDHFLGAIKPDVFGGADAVGKQEKAPQKKTKSGKERTSAESAQTAEVNGNHEAQGAGKEDDGAWEIGSAVESTAEYDHYDFTLQFSCYVLADKLQAAGFKRHILDEIRYYGEFCDPSNLTVDQIRYVYNNTARNDDPLRKFCLLVKFVQTPIHETLGDPDFQQLMQDGGPLVNDVMEICRKHAVKENWDDL
jgi:hypothetical protein